MLQASIQNILLGIDKIAGVEIMMEAESVLSYRIHIVTEKKGKIYSVLKHETDSWEEVEKQITLDTPVCLVLNGKGVIHKAFKKTDTDEDSIQIINRLIPNVNVQEIYSQVFYSGQSGFLSIVRKQILENHLQLFKDKGYSVAYISLGPFVAYDILNQLGVLKKDTFSFNGHQLGLNEKSDLIAYTYNAANSELKDIEIDGEKMPSAVFVAYCAAAQLYLNRFNLEDCIQCNFVIENGIKQHVWKLLKKRGGIAVLAVAFAVLLSNFIFYNIQFKANNKLSASYGANQYKIKNIDSLTKEVNDKNRFLSDAGWLHHTKLSFYSDRIASTVLPSIKLTELSINPLDESLSRKEKKLMFSNYNILIKGTCGSVAELNSWIKELQKNEWLNKVTIENFKYDFKINQSLFVIKIKLN